MSQPLIVTGMHHSGTSLVAELFHRAGVAMGGKFVPGDARKPRGYFEDAEFVTLAREMVAAACAPSEAGWPDWGWTTGETLREEIWPRYEARARQLAESRNAGHPLWGWKDPRTTLLLDFWLRILPNAKFIFTCREPWAVAASVRKLGVALFDQDPGVAAKIWTFYNRRLLAFHRAHPNRCLFLPVSQLNKAPHKLLDRITSHFGFAFISHDRATCNEIVRGWAPAGPAQDRQAERAFENDYPEATALWRDILDTASSQWNPSSSAPSAIEVALPSAPPPPRVSIIIPCFNDGPYLLDALASVEECKDRLHETVIVDDGSDAPETLDILKAVAGRGYSVVRQPNRGVAEALNAGIRASIGEYVLPVAADNKILPAYITRGIEILDANAETGVVYADAEWFGDATGPRPARPFDFYALHLGNYIDTCAMFRRRVWEDAGGYDPGLKLGYEDWDLWLTAAEKGWKFHYIPEILFHYRLRDTALSHRMAVPATHRQVVRHIVAKHPSYAQLYADVIADQSAMMIQPPAKRADSAEIKQLAGELDAARSELRAAQEQIQMVRETASWRVTSPLRMLHRAVSKEPQQDTVSRE
jgi:GT2 family glycosyltransferase